MSHLGDYAVSSVIYGKFTTFRPSTGATYTLGGTPVLKVYKDNSTTTESTSGVTLTADFDGVTGLNHFTIDTSSDGTFYSAGSFFNIIITTGTVDSISVTGSVVGSFTLEKASALRPTTAGRTLDVSAGGEAGVDWANVGSQSTAVNLSSTTTNLVNTVTTYTGNTVQTGDSFARIGATGSGLTSLASQASISALNNISAAQVNAEVLDVLTVDTFAEPAQGTPAATTTLANKLAFLYKAWRNKTTQTATTYSLFNDDAATIDHKATTSDDATTFTKSEVTSGP